MHEDRFEKQTQRERTRMLIHGSWRRVGAKIACAVACTLMVGQLLLPSVTLAAELSEPAAQDAVAAASIHQEIFSVIIEDKTGVIAAGNNRVTGSEKGKFHG